jgi:AcrR family transcriptional regulator
MQEDRPQPRQESDLDSASQPRRLPIQQRSKQQVSRILDTAADLIAESSVDAVTTNAIAARVGISIGTLYQYFPNKTALVRALAVRYLEGLDAILPVPEGEDPTSWSLPQEIERAVQALEGFIEKNPGFLQVYRAARGASDPDSLRLLDRGKQHFAAVFARRAPWIAEQERWAHANIAVEAAHSIFALALTLPSENHRLLVREMCSMLERYLEPIYGTKAKDQS